jgi:hypothetical protein
MKGRKPPVTGPPRPRLYDRVRALDIEFQNVPDCTVIVADEIARQIDALPDDHADRSPAAHEYGCVIPPFRRFFIEAETTASDGTISAQRGVFVEDISPALRAGTLAHDPPPGAHWAMAMHGYLYVTGYPIQTYPGVMVFHLDDRGYLRDDMAHVTVLTDPTRYQRDPTITDVRGLPTHAPYALKAINAMHARCEAEHITTTRQQRREAERRHQVKLKDYYILKVKPTEKPHAFSEVGQAQRVQGQRREHVVRGHFRWYSEEKPLFGKISGMVWIGEHRRGADDIGRIRKDYAV